MDFSDVHLKEVNIKGGSLMDSEKTSIVQEIKDLFKKAFQSHVFRIILLGFLILLLQIPIAMIGGIVGEREARRYSAANEITSKWGKQQTIIGPMIIVPYTVRFSETLKDGTVKVWTDTKYANFLPDTLHTLGNIDSEVRYRGIYKVPVYSLVLDITGEFSRPDFSEWGIEPGDILWDQARLAVRISDARAITNQASLSWNGKDVSFLPGVGEYAGNHKGIHAPMKGLLTEDVSKFSYHLELNGSGGTYFAPFGASTIVELKSDWADPSFQGTWLPSERSVDEKGFQATWNIPFLGRSYPQKWRGYGHENVISSALFGVDLIIPVDQYRMSQRSIKYEFLFLLLTFAALWLFEILSKVRIHSIQYLLVGAGMCLFYLLELSLSEHMGFFIAYICASLAVVVLISAYCIAVLKSGKRSAIMGSVVTLLYCYLYVLLVNQDYALLIGSVGLFLMLAAVMFLTRKVDWYSLNE
jgi:inner membrane protein